MAPSNSGAMSNLHRAQHQAQHQASRSGAKMVTTHYKAPSVVVPALPLPLLQQKKRPSQLASVSSSSPAVAASPAEHLQQHAKQRSPVIAHSLSPAPHAADQQEFSDTAAPVSTANGVVSSPSPRQHGQHQQGPNTESDIPSASHNPESIFVLSPGLQEHTQVVRDQEPSPVEESMPALPANSHHPHNHPHNHTSSTPSPALFNGFAPPPPPPFAGPRVEDGMHPAAANGVIMPQHPSFQHPHMHHHPHPSNGSVMFGGMPDSNNTSPGPPSGGMYPPPGTMGFPGYPVIGPGPGPGPGLGHGHWSRHLPVAHPNGSIGGYPPAMMAFDPSTPHSFHGSQSSNPADPANNFEENGYHPQHAPMMPNGLQNGRPSMENHQAAPEVMPPGLRPAVVHIPRNHELVRLHQEYMEMNYNNPETADCHLTINLSTTPTDQPWRAPVTLLGHRVVLSFSPTLRDHIHAASRLNGPVAIVSDDPHLTNDVLRACLASLYGKPLPDVAEKDFNRAAAYVASGNLLRLHPITMKGVDDVLRLISDWSSLEKALELALSCSLAQFPTSRDTFVTPYPEVLYRYGQASERIIDGIASFIVDNFPPNFKLAASCPDPAYSRIPAVPARQQDLGPHPGHGPELPSAASRLPALRSPNPLLREIKFGDMGPATAEMNGNALPPSPPTYESNACGLNPLNANELLSLALLNLPFGVLKHVMENNGLGNISGWMTTQARFKVVSDLVTEREARRLRALDAVLADRVANAAAVRARLASAQPQSGEDMWDVLGWQEFVTGSDEAPIIVRRWAPVKA